MNLKMLAIVTILVAGFSAVASAADGPTLTAIKQRGQIICGSDGSRPGISAPDEKGVWRGFMVNWCRAVSAAIFGDPDKVKYVALSVVQRFPSLQSGEVDLLSRSETVTLTRNTALGFDFSPVVMYASTALMVPKSLGVTSGKKLDGATVCVTAGSTIERNIATFWQQNHITYKPVVMDSVDQVNKAFLGGRCDVNANFLPGLATLRANQAPHPEDYIILPDVLTKEPIAVAMRQGDPQWKNIITWSVYATFEAEELGISSRNVDEALKSKDPDVQRFLGVIDNVGEKLGVRKDFAYQIVKSVGNYEEIWDSTVGKNSPLKLERGYNKLWLDGGLLYSPPFD